MGKGHLLICNCVGPEKFSLFCHTELAVILDPTELLGSVHLGPLLRSFSGLPPFSKTSDCFRKSAFNFRNLHLIAADCTYHVVACVSRFRAF